MDVAHSAQTFGGLLGRQVTLGFSQHFIADHKFTHRRGAAAADKNARAAASDHSLHR